MNLFGLNIHIARSSRSSLDSLGSTLQRSFDPAAWLEGRDIDPGPTLHNAYEQVVWVYRAVNVLAEQLANIPFLFSRGARGRESLITSGPLLDFYSRPHPDLNNFQYWELRVLWLLLRGECFRIPIYSDSLSSSSSSLAAPKHGAGGSSLSAFGGEGRGEVASSRVTNPESRQTPARAPQSKPAKSASPESDLLSSVRSLHALFSELKGAPRLALPARHLSRVLMLDPAHFHHIIQDHQLVGWRYTGNQQAPLESQVFLPEEVWFEKLPNPFNYWRGLAPLQAATLSAQTDFAAGSFMRGIIENNAETGLIVRSEQQLSDEQREQITAALRQRKRRAGAADQSILLWGANEIVKPQLSSADMQFLKNRKFSRAEICAAFGVPEEIITATDHAKYDVMRGARLNFIENRVAPLCARLEAMEQATVKAIDPSATGWFDLDSIPIMREARRNRLATAKIGFDMGIPFNELNRVLDLGFKPLPWGDAGFLPSTLSPASTIPRSSDGIGIKGEGFPPSSSSSS